MNRNRTRTTIIIGLSMLPALTTKLEAQVPPEFQTLYHTMQAYIGSFNISTLALWDGSKGPVTFSATVTTMNSNNGDAVIDPDSYDFFLRELDGLQALGVKGVVFDIDFPVLDPGFDAYGGQSAAFLDVYKRAAAEVKARGLKLMVETNSSFANSVLDPLNAGPYYNSLTLDQYIIARANQTALLARELQPDYIGVVQEPDTEAFNTGKPELFTRDVSANLASQALQAVKATGVPTLVGAGIGSWQPRDATGYTYADYIIAYRSLPELDYIDIHVYPVIFDYLPRVNTIADLARVTGKKVTISECWSYKIGEAELGLPPSEVYARDVFAFWSPVDIQFLEAMVNWSYYKKLDFMSAFWTQYLRAQIPYSDTTKNLPLDELFKLAWRTANIAVRKPAVTQTGSYYYDFITSPVDTIAPAAPVVSSTNATKKIDLEWTSSDNVGVYKYVVEREGLSITTTRKEYTDQGLEDSTCYDYTVTAFDFKGNATATPWHTCTTDATPPFPPTVITVSPGPVVDGEQKTTSMNINWSGAIDNTGGSGIKAYRIYRSVETCDGPWQGVAEVDASVASYVDGGLKRPYTLYCYNIKTLDNVGLLSGFGTAGSAVSADWIAPSVPGGLAAAGTPGNVTLTWTPATDNTGTAPSYDLQRIIQDQQPVIGTGITGTSFLDTTVAALPDTSAPSAAVKSPAPGSTVRGNVSFLCSCNDKGVRTTAKWSVRSSDGSGNVSNWSRNVSITFDTVGGVLASQKFYVDGNLVYSTTDPETNGFSWDTRTVSNGLHTLTIEAADEAGNRTMSVPVQVTVAN